MKNFLLGTAFGAVTAVYFTGNLKITAEGISITTNRTSSTPDPSVQPPEVKYHGPSTPTEPPTAA
jgi:hypothetical protein